MKKNILVISIAIISLLLTINLVSAHKKLCLTYGQSVPDEQDPRYTCYHDLCEVCVTDNNYPTHSGYCRDMGPCEVLGDPEVDGQAPEISLHSPFEGEIYDTRNILMDVDTDEPCAMYYLDNLHGRDRWKRVCSKCQKYERSRRFREGFNDITFKCIDVNGNKAEIKRTFFVDSSEPRLGRMEPRKGFTDGNFKIDFREENPVELTLICENHTLTKDFPINLSENCIKGRRGSECEVYADISVFDEQEIMCWFRLKDLSENIDETKKTDLMVDQTKPKILDKHHYTDGRYLNFEIEIDEPFF